MEQIPSSEANRFSVSQEIPCILWNAEVHNRIYKCLLPVPILSQINPVHDPHSTSRMSILILHSLLCLGLPNGLVPSGFPTKTLYTLPIGATWPAHLILNMITWIILGDMYRSFSSSLCSFLHSPVTSFLLDPNILNTLFWNTLNLSSSRKVSYQVSHPYKTTGHLIILYSNFFV